MRTYTFIEFWGYGVEKAYLISKHPHIYGNKGISTINIKQKFMYVIKKNRKSIYQANNIEESVMNVGPPPKP